MDIRSKGGARFALPFAFLLALIGSLPAPAGARVAAAVEPGQLDSLARLRLQRQMDTVEIFRKEDGSWWVADRGLPARPEILNQTFALLGSLREQDPHPLASEAALEADGLHLDNAVFVRLSFIRGKPRWLRLGAPRNLTSALAWTRDGGNPLAAKTPRPRQAYRAEGSLPTADIDAWTAPDLLPRFSLKHISRLSVTWTDSAGTPIAYALARHGNSFRVAGPDSGEANPHKAWEVLGQSLALVSDRFMTPGEKPPAAPGAPRVAVTIELLDGRRFHVEARASDDRYDYVPHPMIAGVWVKMLRARLDSFRHTPAFLRTSYPFGPEPDDGIRNPTPPGFGVFMPHGSDEDSSGHEGEGALP